MTANPRQSAPRPWQLWAAAMSIAGLVAGLALSSVRTIHDLAHWSTVMAAGAGPDPSMDGSASEMMSQDLDQLSLIIVGVTAIVLAGSTTAMLARVRVAYLVVNPVVWSYVLCCGYVATVNGPADPTSPPAWMRACQSAGPLTTFGCAASATVLLALPPVRRWFAERRPVRPPRV